MFQALRHRFMMWWSPAYRDRYRLEQFGRAFFEGFLEGIKKAKREPKTLAETLIDLEQSPAFPRIQRMARVATFFYDEDEGNESEPSNPN